MQSDAMLNKLARSKAKRKRSCCLIVHLRVCVWCASVCVCVRVGVNGVCTTMDHKMAMGQG